MTSDPISSFESLGGSSSDHLVAAAAAVASDRSDQSGRLVVIVRPGTTDAHVIADSKSGLLRAAVSVAVSAGDDQLWNAAPDRDTFEVRARAFPEVIASVAHDVAAAHVGGVHVGGRLEAVALWFTAAGEIVDTTSQQRVLAALADGGDAERSRRIGTAAPAAESRVPPATTEREFDPTDPRLDRVTGFLSADRFDEHIELFDEDEAALLLIDLGGIPAVEPADRILRTLADRIAAQFQNEDLVARLGDRRIAIVVAGFDRSAMVIRAKQLLTTIAEPLSVDGTSVDVVPTIALAHQAGLVDLEEMVESAAAALAGTTPTGTGRLVLAA